MLNGLIAKKIEMSQVFKEDGSLVPVTVLEVGPCVVTQIKNENKENYSSLQLGFGNRKPKNLKKSLYGHFKNIRSKPAILKEFPVSQIEEDLKVGKEFQISDIFTVGNKVQVMGVSKGKGFAGVVKRHGFHGGPKTHGQSDRHRAPGSIGGRTDPGRVYKGKKMGGHMGDERITVKGLEVIAIDEKNNQMKIKGAVPGYRGSILTIIKVN
ncbi:50S ribosomal protein L3 [candidate division CPR3 bacterium GWF2_35_18]|uniref:Large ribosomal subunit protein uL3 n=1 Tax=candidate division CPR3 bacterium GW2011_GWF2_35_18 TaxID=1618350 RepID=A0A0G0BJU0_UNCC3|nr:MAG: 50S ribosomal protein L3 [candidate division CPR3 bacterium GW2011_GWF2_35_18]KKP85916.1 MAG: 50S ribosomal protein L3 [candidate division CPR3 bacterium GW2011_GWE2_35_7]OGB63172.1 MAG: 50S ribosomal protein L3 [candidate division CPR3 bacterium GWF2_35_18]OGB64014.1 MAG: 50S ribosomal protein L3 [candidate division CPR3 bacterium RIFOXYA2_FULL_35_13]OGB79603.1 MAG: 50S ribosomal protein L3 [candidate division CPR3 bacterium RIFOXYB2_FULL_35_8]OGB80102.1 MAG: 50S ribosomal protein L3 